MNCLLLRWHFHTVEKKIRKRYLPLWVLESYGIHRIHRDHLKTYLQHFITGREGYRLNHEIAMFRDKFYLNML